MIEIHLTSMVAPPGRVWLAGTRDGLLRLRFGRMPGVRDGGALARHGLVNVHHTPGPLASAVSWLERYFAGQPTDGLPALDLRLGEGFTRRILDVLVDLPIGGLITYNELARAVGSPRGARAVGRALATNPLPIFIPCHRVITQQGDPAGYIGGVAWKRFLLELEDRQTRLLRPAKPKRRGRRGSH